MMDSIINNIANLPLSWSVLFMFFVIAIAYYWNHILPKIKNYKSQENLIKTIIPEIGNDIDLVEKYLKELKDLAPIMEKQLSNLGEIILKVSSISTKLDSGMAISLKEQNEIKRLILTEMQHYSSRTMQPTPQVQSVFYQHRGEERSSPLDNMSIAQIRDLLRQGTREVSEANVDSLKNALSYLEEDVKRENNTTSAMELDKLLTRY